MTEYTHSVDLDALAAQLAEYERASFAAQSAAADGDFEAGYRDASAALWKLFDATLMMLPEDVATELRLKVTALVGDLWTEFDQQQMAKLIAALGIGEEG